MTIPPPLLRGGETGSSLIAGSWVVGMGGGAEPVERERDADPEDEEVDAIHRGIEEELPRLREKDVGVHGDIYRMGEFPTWMRSRTAARVRPGALHQQRLPSELFLGGGGGGPSYDASSRS
jgi:hypothetical protein